MSYLYSNRKARPFNPSSKSQSSKDSDEGEDLAWDQPKKKSRAEASRAAPSAPSAPSSSSSAPKPALDERAVIVDLDAAASLEVASKAYVRISGPPALKKKEEEVVLIEDEDDGNNEELAHLKRLLNKVDASKKQLAPRPDVQVLDIFQPAAAAEAMPVVQSAAQRMLAAQAYQKKWTPKTAIPAPSPAAQGPSVNIRTRLNGQHEHTWKMCMADSMSVLMQRMNALYSVPQGKISLIFDGEKLTPEKTPEMLEFDEGEDVLIDAKIDKSLFAKAVAAAEAKGGGGGGGK